MRRSRDESGETQTERERERGGKSKADERERGIGCIHIYTPRRVDARTAGRESETTEKEHSKSVKCANHGPLLAAIMIIAYLRE